MLKELETNLGLNHFFAEFKVNSATKIAMSQKQFLEERKQITPGKP